MTETGCPGDCPPPVWGRFPETVSSLADNSRQVEDGTLFLVRPGSGFRWEYVDEALDRGASFLVADHTAFSEIDSRPELSVRIRDIAGLSLVEDLPRTAGQLASAWWSDPSVSLKVVGVTGTNGKTTSSFLTRAVCRSGGMPCGLIGTVVFDVGKGESEAPQTTPGALLIQSLFADSLRNGLKAVSMEVSSHALDQGRLEGTTFSVVHFTNLTRDHLDYHRTMEAYFEAKSKLLFWKNPDGSHPVAVVHTGDEYGERLAKELEKSGRRFLTYGEGPEAGIRPLQVDVGLSGIRGKVRTPRGDLFIESSLSGHYNLQNILGAIGCGEALDIPPEKIVEGIRSLSGVPGRFERVEAPTGFAIIVDYAHTDDALSNLLRAVRPVTRGKVITVFGCGGDRDRGKRPRMGKVAGSLSDFVVVTSDNPRTEDPEAILDEIEPGIRETGTPYVRLTERKSAIAEAIRRALPGDAVVIAGKGHETYQILGKEKIHFDDREIARLVLGEIVS
ncbi:MAG: UDP-N-acetylmuramoyl-L-alanyl-D-glutamate--2,6-diaminopimelate ligase [Nitrospirae bacterium]|nr:UDP-N-acetylmuramoyl-L-alanyl-D-glutamate--2,6-diaminopimelate ligase [Nitrospirota bacterium]